jgi:D-alanyl-D-alanine endopeptidase (penicillin-binding protein 7)
LSRARIGAGLALVVVVLVGYSAERNESPEPEFVEAIVPRVEARPVVARHVAKGWTSGPWVPLEPPRKLRPRLRSHAVCVVDGRSGALLYGRRAEEIRPIASIVKLLTALVYLESGGDLSAEIEITPEDAKGAGKSILWKGHRFKAKDVLYAALMSSENRAARALARSTPYTPEQFIERMRERAKEIGCTTMKVVEPTGLSELNVASSVDVARLLIAALANPTISEVCRTYRYQFRATNKKKTYRLTSSNRMIVSKYRVRGGKTGYISEAGWCLANMIDAPFGPLVTVVMASRSNSHRFAETRRLIEWALKNRSRAHTFALAD